MYQNIVPYVIYEGLTFKNLVMNILIFHYVYYFGGTAVEKVCFVETI